MKKILFIFLVFVECIFCSVQVYAATLVVGKNKPYTSIKIALLHCKNGDTILVEAGLYKEQEIVIDKSVVLKGIGQPVLDGEGKCQLILIKAGNTVIDGFKLQHSGRSDLADIA